jgi:signal transduction histidine kinase
MMRLSFLRQNPSLPGDVITEIEALDKEARRTADLTKKLVLFGQQQFLKKEPLSLRDSMARLQPEITRLLGKGIQLYVTGGTSPEWVDADAGLVDQVILSICSNARDAMPQGGCLIIEVSGVDHAPLPAAPEGDGRQGAFGRISFQDTGCGMDTSVVQRLFEPFFTTKGGHGGIGLGLAAVHGIVKQHRGWMEVESSPGHGSTFRVFLPRAPEPSVA